MGDDHADVDDESDCTDCDDGDDDYVEEFTTLEERNMREPSYVFLDDEIIINRLLRPAIMIMLWLSTDYRVGFHSLGIITTSKNHVIQPATIISDDTLIRNHKKRLNHWYPTMQPT